MLKRTGSISALAAFVALGAGQAMAQDCTEYLIDVNNLNLSASGVSAGSPFNHSNYTGTVTVTDDGNTGLEGIRIDGVPQAGIDSTLADFLMTVTFNNGSVTGGSLSMMDNSGRTYVATLIGGSGVFETQGAFFFKFPADSGAGTFSAAVFAGADVDDAFSSGQNGSLAGNILQFQINSGNNQDPSFVTTGVDDDTDCDVFIFGCEEDPCVTNPDLPECQRCDCYWENGDPILEGQRSIINGYHDDDPRPSQYGKAADDFCLEKGYVYDVHRISGYIITNRTDEPDGQLDLYKDCDGCPEDEPFYTAELTGYEELTDLGDGFTLYRYDFELEDLWLTGNNYYWVSILDRELYYTATREAFFAATDGQVDDILSEQRAAISKARDNITDTPLPDDWTSTAGINLHCREFAFEVCAEPCPIICDNGEWTSSGTASVLNTTLPNSRVADNFVLNPCFDATVCYIRGYVATNCNPDNGLMEIYANTCYTGEDAEGNEVYGDSPIGDPICSAPVSHWYDTGYTLEIDNKILPVYCYEFFGFDCPLMGNANYWVSIINRGTGSFNERGYFLHKDDCTTDCDIKISEGRALSPGAGIDVWTPISELGWGGGQAVVSPRDFAFLVAGDMDDESAAVTGCWIDVNGDGIVNGQDVGMFLNAYSAGCGL